MLVSLVNQALKERGRAYLALCLGLVLYLALTLGLFPTVTRSEAVVAWLGKMNAFLFWGIPRQSTPLVDWLNLTGFAAVLPLALSISAMANARDWILTSQGGNQLTLLLSYPTSRRQMLGGIFLIQAAFLFGLTLISAGVLIIGSLADRLNIPPLRILFFSVILSIYCLFYSFIVFLAGNLSGKPWAAVALGVGAFILAVSIYLLPGFTHLPAWIRWISPLASYLEGNPLLTGLRAVNWLGTAGWTVAAGVVAWLHFERLDLGN
jgi:hypothetical protein